MGKVQHPSIQEFKLFVKNHPKLVQEVRKGKKTWQDLYEDWYLLGEDDEQWKQYENATETKDVKNEDTNSDLLSKVLATMKNVKIENVQEQISNVGNAISTIQNVIDQFQSFKKPNDLNSQRQSSHPFVFRKD